MDTALPVKATIEEIGTTALAREMGLPISTVHGWKEDDRIPGRGKLLELRITAFVAAVDRLKTAKDQAA